uniref:Dynein light chain n=1 Tax=Serinus canaria TaxID=9135 RepID=A0A8C9NBM0_SERCA
PRAAAGGAVFESGAAPGRRARGAPSGAERAEAARPGLLTPPSPWCRASPSRGGPVTVKEFDKKYNPTWHCIVGRNFGSYVTHETKHFIYFYLGQVAILLFKSG